MRPNRSKKATVTIDSDVDDEPNLSEISSDEWSPVIRKLKYNIEKNEHLDTLSFI